MKLKYIVILILLASGCKSYKQNIMLQVDKKGLIDSLNSVGLAETKKNYILLPNDRIGFKVYTQKGERLVDPDYELSKYQGTGFINVENAAYLINSDSMAVLPMIGKVKMAGYTLRQADSVLTSLFAKYYTESYVITKVINHRIVILGGQGGKVIPLENENTHLIEAIALYGIGAPKEARMDRIRLVRGDLKNPQIQVIDLTTIEGFKKASMVLQPNDIVYIESRRRAFYEFMQDVAPVIGLISALASLIFAYLTYRNSIK